MERYWLICYDIKDEKRLRRVANLMTGYGIRVQKSIFECWLRDSQLEQLKSEMNEIVDPDEDDIRFYVLCATCREFTKKYTQTKLREQEKYFLV